MDMKLELVAVPVSDPDRAKAFYTEQAGFNADHDIPSRRGCASSSSRLPARRARSRWAMGVTDAEPGSVAACSWW